ncbi:CCA tRNA nucleotidyltransferase [Candidatus Peregrinibacteria bacterium]|nr:CCA tRNA nucleotidyltransferase [Candidatus Peregrinibacteria bacterium]
MPLAKETIALTMNTKLGERAYRAAEIVFDNGYEAWWVGGCVRDMLLGKIPKDIDIATDAKPAELVKLFAKCDDSRADLGAVVISLAGSTFEVTTFRKETDNSDGREPTGVTFTDRAQDAQRRDITANAIYWNPISQELWDPFEGEKDLHEKLIRIIGDPGERIRHDALRLLRIIRFRATINGQYHPDTFHALHAHAALVKTISGFRCFQELEKSLLCPHPETVLEDLWETDVLEHLLPELYACKGIGQPSDPHTEGDVWNHILKLVSSFTEDHGKDVRWAALLHDVGKAETFSIEHDRIHFNEHASVGAKIAGGIFLKLQCEKARKEKICWLIEHHMMMGTFREIDEERKAHWYHHPWFIELLQLFWLDIAGTGRQDFALYEEIIADYNRFLDAHPRPAKPLLTGNEVMEILGIQPGEAVGRVLKALHDAQTRKEVTTKKEARDFLKRVEHLL